MKEEIFNSKEYWDNFYFHFVEKNESDFARFCAGKISELVNPIIIELGCGNGRDSIYFNSLNIPLFSFDLSEVAIRKLEKLRLKNTSFNICDFRNINNLAKRINELAKKKIKIFYSRFTMHCVNEEVENELLLWLLNNMNGNDYLFIESRTEIDELYGKGIPFDGGFVTSHYRRFLNYENFKTKISKMGFKVQYEILSKGLAVQGDEDPRVMRFVLRGSK